MTTKQFYSEYLIELVYRGTHFGEKNILIILKSYTPLCRQFYPLLSFNNHIFADDEQIYISIQVFSLLSSRHVSCRQHHLNVLQAPKKPICQKLSTFPSLLLPTTHTHRHTDTQTHTLMGICQRDTGANWKSSQWPKLKQFEQN